MVISPTPSLQLRCINVQGLRKFKCLSRCFTSELDHLDEVKCQIEQAKYTFMKGSSNLNLKMKPRDNDVL